jgi:hypothetical protein
MAIIPADEKVFMVDKRTNTTYGGSQALQNMQQWYTMQDVSDSIQPYKVYTALLNQEGETNPTAIVLQNTLGNITFFRSDAGRYSILGDNLFDEDKTFITIQQLRLNGFEEEVGYFDAKYFSVGQISLDTYFETGGYSDGMMTNVPIEIRVYN